MESGLENQLPLFTCPHSVFPTLLWQTTTKTLTSKWIFGFKYQGVVFLVCCFFPRVFLSVSLFSYHRLCYLSQRKSVVINSIHYCSLSANEFFYYTVFIVFSPILVFIVVLYLVISSYPLHSSCSWRVLRTKPLKFALKLLLIGTVVRCCLSHSFYLFLTNIVSQHTLPFIMCSLTTLSNLDIAASVLEFRCITLFPWWTNSNHPHDVLS